MIYEARIFAFIQSIYHIEDIRNEDFQLILGGFDENFSAII